MSSMRTSHAAGRKSIHTLSNVYLTIWCAAGSTHSVTCDGLVHLAIDVLLELLLLVPLFRGRCLFALLRSFCVLRTLDLRVLRVVRDARVLVLVVVEQLGREVVDLEDVVPVERLLAGEVVVAGLELEVHEVGLGDEARLVEPRARPSPAVCLRASRLASRSVRSFRRSCSRETSCLRIRGAPIPRSARR